MNKNNILLLTVYAIYGGLLLPTLIANYFLIAFLIVCAAIIIRERQYVFTKNIPIMFLLIFFLAHIVGLYHSENLKQGFFDLEKKMSLFLIPFFGGTLLSQFSNNQWQKFRIVTGVISLSSSIGYIAIGTFKYFLKNDTGAFYFENFIPFNYVYYSFYLSFTILCFIHELWDSKGGKVWRFIILFLLPTYTLTVLTIVSSKMGIISFLVGFCILLIFKIKNLKLIIVSFIFIIMISTFLVFLNVTTLERFSELKGTIEIVKKDRYSFDEPFTGLTLRLALWKVGIQHLMEDKAYVFGVGTGDAQDYLNKIYIDHNLDGAGYIDFNSHNQWVQTFLQLGLIGVLLFGSLFISAFIKAFKQKNFPVFLFLIVTLCVSISESILEVNKGILFFALFFTLLMSEENRV